MSPRQRKNPTEAGFFLISRKDGLAASGRQVLLGNIRSSTAPIKLAVRRTGWRQDEIATHSDIAGVGRHCNQAIRPDDKSSNVLSDLIGTPRGRHVRRKGECHGLVILRNGNLACVRRGCQFRHFRPDDVVLIGGNCYRRQNPDDRNHDHQFDQGKALLYTFHLLSPLRIRTPIPLASRGCWSYLRNWCAKVLGAAASYSIYPYISQQEPFVG